MAIWPAEASTPLENAFTRLFRDAVSRMFTAWFFSSRARLKGLSALDVAFKENFV
jgi:hypothetical protein